jgi:hypothetical protein
VVCGALVAVVGLITTSTRTWTDLPVIGCTSGCYRQAP